MFLFSNWAGVALLIILVGCPIGPLRGAEKSAEDLFAAAEKSDLDRVRELLDRGVKVDVRNGQGFTPLMRAAVKGHSKVVQALLAAGADANAKAHDGWTVLMWTSIRGHVPIVEMVIDQGGKVNA